MSLLPRDETALSSSLAHGDVGLLNSLSDAPPNWAKSCSRTECTLHQISPYIGKLKSSIAGDLVEKYSVAGDLVVDPFAGSATIPLEAALRKRRVFASDVSPYSRVLSRAKLSPPNSLQEALHQVEEILRLAHKLRTPDLRHTPQWVREFFHPKTLKEAISFATVCRESGNEFLLACFLGILHHERPGFLSYPSSHLVPYLRDRSYPRDKFPQMYSYRELRSRMIAKVVRVFARYSSPQVSPAIAYQQAAIQQVELPKSFDCVITSPPYMNALDYGRDNRLRLWFIDPDSGPPVESGVTRHTRAFFDAMCCLASKIDQGLKQGGHCVLVVGESVRRSFKAHPSSVVLQIMSERSKLLRLRDLVCDDIPDVRRTRGDIKGVKTEHFLIFEKT